MIDRNRYDVAQETAEGRGMMDIEGEMINVKVRDVIQIVPDERVKQVFHFKFALVDEVVNWGVKAHISTFEGAAHLRLVWGTFEVIGPAAFVPFVPRSEDDDH